MKAIEREINIIKNNEKYKIIDRTLSKNENIYCRNFIIIFMNEEIVKVFVGYSENNPISATLYFIQDSPDVSFVNIIRLLLAYIYNQISTLTEVRFEDQSNIEFINQPNVYPIPLYYFSIAFNGETWYEKHFRARHRIPETHVKYRDTVNQLLHDKEFKSSISFIEFLRISQPPMEIADELEAYYRGSATFGDFFQSIPREHRCRLVRDWISTFMTHYLRDVFDNTNWIIELPIRMSGGKSKSRNNHTRKYYCPKGRIYHSRTFRDFGVSALDI
jgi:hypothetical protein